MKAAATLCLLGLASLASCEEKKETSLSPVTEPPASPPIPDSDRELSGAARAAAAARRVKPALDKDLQAKGLHFGDPVFIRALKKERDVELFIRNRATGKFDLFRTYPIHAASGILGPKLAEGDWQVPEGFYFVPPSEMNPNSQFHLSFNIGYPNEYDRAHGSTGSAIMIHGNQVSIGCLAMSDEKIEEIYTLCDAAHHGGQPMFRVHVFPFRMTPEHMAAESLNPNIAFWQNLREGYDLFEKNHIPPSVIVSNGLYRFTP